MADSEPTPTLDPKVEWYETNLEYQAWLESERQRVELMAAYERDREAGTGQDALIEDEEGS